MASFVQTHPRMDPTLTTHPASAQTPLGRLRAICAHSGLDLDAVDPTILQRMRLLAETTETLRDCERATDIAEDIFRYYDAFKPPREHFTELERRTVVIGTLFSDIGKSGPAHATADGQRLVAEMFSVERVLDGKSSVTSFFASYFRDDADDRGTRFSALGLDVEMSMREFWNLHSVWTLEILRGDGVPPQAVAAAATHHLLENVNPHEMFVSDQRLHKYVGDGCTFARPEKLVILLDKYDAARRRGRRTHSEAITWLRELLDTHPRFSRDREFFALIDGLDGAIERRLASVH